MTNSYSNDKYLHNCTYVKTILMFLVILGHSVAFWSGSWFTENPIIPSRGLDYLYCWLNSFHTFTFSLVSGYIFASKILKGGYNTYVSFLVNKVKRLVIPYFFAALIWVVPLSAYFFRWDGSYLIKKYILCINPSQLWFLCMLFDVFAICWPLRKIILQSELKGVLIVLAFYVIGLVGGRMLPNVFCIWTACQYIPFFYIGMRIRIKQEQGNKLFIESISIVVWVIADVILFITYVSVENMDGIVASMLEKGVKFLLHIVGSVMAFTVLQMLAEHVMWEKSSIFKALSSYSMPMYLFHQQIIYFTLTWLNGKVNPYINAGVNFAAAFAGSFLISWLIMRFKTTRVLMGEK